MNPKFKKFLIIWILLLSAAIIFQYFYYQKNVVPLQVSYLDVGQGDATLIDYQNHDQLLIDGGPSGKDLLSQLGREMPFWDRKIEVVVLTHPDKDHLAGLIELAKRYDIGLFLDNGQTADTEVYKELEQMLKQKNIRREHVWEGSEINFGQNVSIKVFNPDEISQNQEERNDASVVLRMDYGQNSFLFSGDAEEATESDMLSDQENVDVDWLKVSHHGSRTASSEIFLEKVTPKFAVISLGKENRYGHPHEEALQRLQKTGATILRTDEKGTIEVFCQRPKEICNL